MERRIIKIVPVKDIIFDETIYPRQSTYWQTSYTYSQEMLAGAKFPPITLALFQGKLVLIDGKHRTDATKLLKQETILAEVHTGWDKKRMFEEAIKRNLAHGQALSPYDKRSIALKLRNMHYNLKDISQLIQVPAEKVTEFIAQRLTNSITGETITEVIVKSPLKHLAGKEVRFSNKNSLNDIQENIASKSQVILLDQIIQLIEFKLLDLKDKSVAEKYEHLRKLIK